MTIDHTEAITKSELGATQPMLLDGELRLSSDGSTIDAIDPSTGRALGGIPNATDSDVDRAVSAARGAFDKGPWRTTSPNKRATAIRKLAALCRDHTRDLARIEALDVGMPIGMARKLSAGALTKTLEYYAGWADKIYGEVVPLGNDGSIDYTLREPYGVIATVIPWNTPLLFVGGRLGPALAAGNVVILKPSEQASLSALRVAKLALDAGFPPGVVQVVSGDAETGRKLVAHPDVDKVSFTGGGAIASKILAETAKTIRPTIMELGGKSANIVFDDANLDRAAFLSTMGVFGLSGQACAAASRLLVQRAVYDRLVESIAKAAKTIPLGDPLDPMTMFGPLVSADHRNRVLARIQGGRDEGASLELTVTPPEDIAGGSFVGPHIFTSVTTEMSIWRDEIFGPVLCAMPFDTEDEVIAIANDSAYGLGAGIWTKSPGRAHRMARKLRAGNVWINHYGMLPVAAPFGGMRGSGWGREGGRNAMDEYTQVKNVFMDLSD